MGGFPVNGDYSWSFDNCFLLDIHLFLLGKELVPALIVKYLGVTFDPNLTFPDHFNRVKHVFDRNILITVINTLGFNKLFYCSSVCPPQASSCSKLRSTVL